MRREPPDLQFYAEVRDLNLEFLGLIAEARQGWPGPVFGLDPAVVEHFSRLRAPQFEAMAATPCLLAGFAERRPMRALGLVAEPRPGVDAAWLDRARLFSAGLWSYVWQMSRRDCLRASLCAGAPRAGGVGALSFREMRAAGEQALHYLEARFTQGRFWPDLVRAVRDGHPERLRLAHLSAIQLATGDTRERRYALAPAVAEPGVDPGAAADAHPGYTG
jgi:hypothetical protein